MAVSESGRTPISRAANVPMYRGTAINREAMLLSEKSGQPIQGDLVEIIRLRCKGKCTARAAVRTEDLTAYSQGQ